MTVDELYSTLKVVDVNASKDGNRVIIGSSEYVPIEPVEGFSIVLYKNTAENHRVDKTNYIRKVGELNGALRTNTNMIYPSILMFYESLPNFNYIYIVPFKRWYYVSSIEIVRTNLYEISLEVDVLMTYKDGIKKLDAFIVRNEHTYNDFLIDDKRVIEQGYDVDILEVESPVFEADYGGSTPNGSFVLSGLGFSVEEIEVNE